MPIHCSDPASGFNRAAINTLYQCENSVINWLLNIHTQHKEIVFFTYAITHLCTLLTVF